MSTVYTSLSLHEIHHLKNLLQSAGIGCRIQNERLSSLAGEVPFTECAMRLEIENEDDRNRAEAIIREFAQPPARSASRWTCQSCAEELEGQFTSCWRCGTERPKSVR